MTEDGAMKRYRPAFLIGLASILLLYALLREAPANQNEFDPEELYAAEISTVGMDQFTGAPVVLVRAIDSGRVVPIWIGINEAQAIARALHGIEPPRPMTHDLMAALMRAGGNEIEQIAVHDIREGTYYGAIHLKRGTEEQVMKIDSRPSDALALALRLETPIRLAGKVIEEARDFQFVPPEESEQVVRVLGMTAVYPSEERRQQFDLGDREGVLVSDVTGVAAEKGIEAGDLIVKVGDNPVRSPAELLNLTGELRPGSEVRLTYVRNGEEKEVILKVPAEEESLVPI